YDTAREGDGLPDADPRGDDGVEVVLTIHADPLVRQLDGGPVHHVRARDRRGGACAVDLTLPEQRERDVEPLARRERAPERVVSARAVRFDHVELESGVELRLDPVEVTMGEGEVGLDGAGARSERVGRIARRQPDVYTERRLQTLPVEQVILCAE